MAVGEWSEEDVKNGLRTADGALVGGLVVLDYAQGWDDFNTGAPPPPVTSASYDLGRRRAAEKAEAKADFDAWMAREEAERDRRFRHLLKDHPDALAEYEQKIAAIRARQKL